MQQKSNEITKAYGDRDKFLVTFNPDLQQDICGDSDLCFFGGAPTLAQINATYGSQTAAMWLVPQLYNLSEFCGCKDKLEGRPLEECASVIAGEFFYLSVTELMLFFHRFKSGRYGRFYGTVDPLVITTSIRVFLNERVSAYIEHEKEEERRKDRESSQKSITWKDYCMKEYGEIRENPLYPKPKPKEKKEPTEDETREALSTAEWIVGQKDDVRESFERIFTKKYGKTPEEFIKSRTKE